MEVIYFKARNNSERTKWMEAFLRGEKICEYKI